MTCRNQVSGLCRLCILSLYRVRDSDRAQFLLVRVGVREPSRGVISSLYTRMAETGTPRPAVTSVLLLHSIYRHRTNGPHIKIKQIQLLQGHGARNFLVHWASH